MYSDYRMINQQQKKKLREYYDFRDIRIYKRNENVDSSKRMYEMLNDRYNNEMNIQRPGMINQQQKKKIREYYDFRDIRIYKRNENVDSSKRMYEILNDRYNNEIKQQNVLSIGDEWLQYVKNQVRSLNEPFILTLKSAKIFGLTKEFPTFNNFYHFEQWLKAILSAGALHGSDIGQFGPGRTESNDYDAFTNSILSISPVTGGCNKRPESLYRKIKGTYNNFNTISPISGENNCGIVCIAYLLKQNINPLKVRKEFGLDTGVCIEPKDLLAIYNRYNENSRFLVVIDKDISQKLDFDQFDYIMHDKNHYQVVESVDHVEVGKRRKRALLAMDFETRPTEEFVMIGNNKSYLLKDSICSVAYQEYSTKKQCPLIRNTFITNSDRSSARQFLDFLEQEHRKGKHYNIVAFNGGRFDYYFLISQLTETELLHTDINLRGYTVIGMNYLDHTFRDPMCFLVGSLSKLCKSFQVRTPKLTEFEIGGRTLTNENLCFYKPELSFNEFMELEQKDTEFWKIYVEYCEFDCISLRELWISFTSTTNYLIHKMNPLISRACSVNGCKTVGSLAKKIIENLQIHDKFKSYEKYVQFYKTDGEVDINKYKFVCNFKRGGISHCNQAGKHEHPVAGVDITSQYPAAMVHMKIPSGYSKFYEDGKYHEKLHGYYKLTNLKFKKGSPLFKPISSKNAENGVLEWNNETINEIYIDSELLKYVIKHYGLIEFNVERSLLSSSYKLGRDLFGRYVNVLFEEKARQDLLKQNGDPAYNHALREVIKLLLNCLSGKMVEDPSHYKSLVYSNGGEKNINGVGITEERNDKINLWVGTGVSIYSYSKQNLFEYIRLLPNDSNDVIHIETDGIYFDARLMSEFEKNVTEYDGDYPIALGSNLGNIKIEHVSQGSSYWLGKKFYYMYDHGDVIRIKGIPMTTIDDHGNRVTLVNKSLYEQVYVWKPGNKPIKREFKTLRKNFFGQTMISSHTMSRTITPRMTYNVYT